MRRTIVSALAGLLGSVVAGADAAPAVRMESLGWLSGCWAGEGEEFGTGEQWSALAGGTLFGTARTVKNGRTVGFEFMQLRTLGDGRIAFIAHPAAAPGTEFSLIEGSSQRAVFENLDHDFPQRVIYRREGERLLGRIEGVEEGEPKAFDFPMRRVDCEAAAP